MPVYLIRAGESGPVKIGWSADVVGRLVKMQADNHERLRVLRLFEGGETEERGLHERFADLHIRGEWFSYSRGMLDDLGIREIEIAPKLASTPCIVEPVYVAPDNNGSLLAARRMRGITLKQIADHHNVTHTTVLGWQRGRVPAEHCPRLALFLHVSRHDLRPDLFEAPVMQASAA